MGVWVLDSEVGVWVGVWVLDSEVGVGGCIGRSRGATGTCPPPPNITQLFHFCIRFHQKAPALEVGAPQKEILDLPLGWVLDSHCVCSVDVQLWGPNI